MANDNLRTALDIHEVGVALMRQNLRRAYPDDSDAGIDARLLAWLRQRPGADGGDAVGRVVVFGQRP